MWDNSLLETRGYDGPNAGWTNIPAANYLIFHPMEPSVPIRFYLDYVKLCAENKTVNNTFTIRGVCSDAEQEPLNITLLYGNGRGTNFSGTEIIRLTNQRNGEVKHIWNTANVAGGSYTIRAIVSDGTNTLIRDSLVPVIVEGAPQLPVAIIKANGEQDYATINQGTPLTVTVSLDAGSYSGLMADWWAVAFYQNNNQWYYLNSSMVLIPFSGNLAECHPAYQGPLFNLDSFPIASNYILPAGTYVCYCGVDLQDDILNFPAGPMVYSVVTVNIE
jgi:hypothetical protein